MTDTKPRSVANINASPSQHVLRHIGRIKTLKGAIDKAIARGNQERVDSLQAEYDRRMVAVNEIKADLDSL